MQLILDFFNIGNIAFTVIEYPMSYIELIGTILYLWSVWLITKKNMLTWPIGILSVILYFYLFYQIRLYSDAAEQIYYLFASIYGWWIWNEAKDRTGTATVEAQYSRRGHLVLWAILSFIASLALAGWISDAHIRMPAIFPEAASFPFVDALTTIMSFTAMFLMTRKKLESWIYWIIVDIIGIWLYFVKDVQFISLLYVILLVLAIKGFTNWRGKTNLIQKSGLVV